MTWNRKTNAARAVDPAPSADPQALSQRELDRRIRAVADRIAVSTDPGDASSAFGRPRRILPAELVRLMDEYIVLN